MIVDNFDVVGVAIGEAEAETPLFVDSDAVPASAVALQRFESITGRHSQKVECRGSVQLSEFTLGYPFHAYEAAYSEPIGEPLCILTSVAPNHLPLFSAIAPQNAIDLRSLSPVHGFPMRGHKTVGGKAVRDCIAAIIQFVVGRGFGKGQRQAIQR